MAEAAFGVVTVRPVLLDREIHAMLRRGLGRHRAFGHGMILLTK